MKAGTNLWGLLGVLSQSLVSISILHGHTTTAASQLPPKIDTHHHFIPEIYRNAVEDAGGDPSGWPTPSWSPEASLKSMEVNGIAKAYLSVTAPGATIAPTNGSAADLARKINEYGATLRQNFTGKFGFFATLPSLTDVDASLEEIRYALDVLKADGVTLFTRYGDANYYLGHPMFTPIWEELDKRRAVVFIHPTHPVDLNWINPVLPQPAIDYPQETTKTAIDMIISNVTRDFPNCRKILSHAGGTLPFLLSRLSMTSEATEDTRQMYGKTSAEWGQEFRSFYFDLALSSSPAVLRLMLDLVPHNRITYGSDFPYADSAKIVGFKEHLDAFKMTRGLRDKIYFKNAEHMFSRNNE